jgi:DNA polymerase I-like protein with 3'-5' exonuclease and polymerase domains
MGKSRKVNGTDSVHMSLFPPESNWTPPETYPDIWSAKTIAIDLETRDPNLMSMGPGGVRNDGEIVGVAVATDSGYVGYFPFGHLGGGNMDRDITLSWLGNGLKKTNAIIVGANIPYDLEWLMCSGVDCQLDRLTFHDVQIIEGLLDEEGHYSLEALSNKYLGISKDEGLLEQAARSFGVHPKAGLWKLHSKYVGPYGEGDARNTLLVYRRQLPLIKKEGLEKIFELEHSILPVVLQMRLKGIRVDLEKAEALNNELLKEYEQELYNIKQDTGLLINPWATSDLIKVCEHEYVSFPRTAKGNPSFKAEWLEVQPEPVLQRIVKARTLDRLRGTFIKQKIIEVAVNGRIHSEFKQMPSDEGGTRTGRFSSANPNMQQYPSRSELAPRVRGLFIPEPGENWAKLDYSQQEPRIAVHFALACKLHGAEQAKQSYVAGEDFYKFVTNAAGITRRQAKNLTLGRMYGMGFKKMAERLHCSEAEAANILKAFDTSAPFLKKLADKASAMAKNRGYITTLGGRHRHFDTWVPVGSRSAMPKKKDMWVDGENLERFGCHKALNSLIQGSAADMTKHAMLNIYKETGFVPLSQVHDELNYSVDTQDTAEILKDMCETALPLEVPVVCDLDYGESWK